MRRFRDGWIGRVHIGTTYTALIYELPPILRELRPDHPGIDLVVTNMPTRDSVENIIQNEIDLALVTLPVEEKQLSITPLRPEMLVAILPAGTRDVPDEVTPDYVARQPLLIEHARGAVHALVMRWLSGHMPLPRDPMHLGTIEALKTAVASNLGMSIVPDVAVARHYARLSSCGRCGRRSRAHWRSSSTATSRTSPRSRSYATRCSRCEKGRMHLRPGGASRRAHEADTVRPAVAENTSSVDEGIAKPGHQLDELGLSAGVGLGEQAMQMRLDRGLADAQRVGDLPYPAALDDGEQNPQLARRVRLFTRFSSAAADCTDRATPRIHRSVDFFSLPPGYPCPDAGAPRRGGILAEETSHGRCSCLR